MAPLVSVVCPTFNRSEAILDTVASVQGQSLTDWELIVVSDGCTDDTEQHVLAAARHDSRLRLLRTPHCGHPSEPRNAGLAAARAPLVAYLDHDDRWHPEHLRIAVAALDGGADAVATGFERRDVDGRVLSSSLPLMLFWHPEIQVLTPMFEPSRVVHRAGLAERAGGWRAGPGLEDWDLWLRMTDGGVRFTTVLDATTVLLADPRTRMNRLRRPHRMVIATFRHAAMARAAARTLAHPDHVAASRTAAAADLESWFGRLAECGEITTPRGWDGRLSDAIAEATRAELPLWTDLVVVAHRGRYQLAQQLWCATTGHARRIAVLARAVQPAQLALAARICEQHGADPTGLPPRRTDLGQTA